MRVVLRGALRRQGDGARRDHADAVEVTAMHPGQRCTVASVAGHAMYERANPYFEHVAGGTLDMSECRYEQIAPKTTRITGAKFRPRRRNFASSSKARARSASATSAWSASAIPYTIAHVDEVIAWARDKVRERFGETGYELHYTVYGRDGIMGELEPMRDRPAHELCILVQGVAPTAEMAEEVCMIGTRQMFYARLPEVKGSAGSVAFALDEVLRASPRTAGRSITRCAATIRSSSSRPT